MLDATSWKSVFYGRGWSNYSGGTSNPNSGGTPRFDKQVVCSVSGPEPG